MPTGCELAVGTRHWVIANVFKSIRATKLTLYSVKYTPSAPDAITSGLELACGKANSVICPETVMRATLFAFSSANQMFPSEPSVGPCGQAPAVGTLNKIGRASCRERG